MPFEVYFEPAHRDDGPLRPRSADEFADVVDRMQALRDFDLSFAFITRHDEAGTPLAFLAAVAAYPDEDLGAMLFSDPLRGNLYSTGPALSPPGACAIEDFPHLCYAEFGHHRTFPLDSKVPIEDIKAALRSLYGTPASPPRNLAWSEWEWG